MDGKHVSENKNSFIARHWRKCLVAALAFVFLFSGWKLFDRYRQTRESEKVAEAARDAAVHSPAPRKTEPSAPPQDTEESVPEPEKPPIEVDFAALLEMNQDVKAWLYCEDSVLNFEIMQSNNNYYYLGRLPNNVPNMYGSVFIDYRCAGDFSDANTVIYGHDMQNGTVFGSLEKYKQQEYYDSHSVLYLLTPDRNYRLEAVCGFLHTASSSMYRLPSDADAVAQFLPDALAQSTFIPRFSIEEGDRFVTLSTCNDDYLDARYALICRLVEIG